MFVIRRMSSKVSEHLSSSLLVSIAKEVIADVKNLYQFSSEITSEIQMVSEKDEPCKNPTDNQITK